MILFLYFILVSGSFLTKDELFAQYLTEELEDPLYLEAVFREIQEDATHKNLSESEEEQLLMETLNEILEGNRNFIRLRELRLRSIQELEVAPHLGELDVLFDLESASVENLGAGSEQRPINLELEQIIESQSQ